MHQGNDVASSPDREGTNSTDWEVGLGGTGEVSTRKG